VVGLVGTLRRAVLSALDHDVLTLAQATAYASILALFPALVVAAAVLTLMPVTTPLRMQLAAFFDSMLPSTVTPLLNSYFAATHSTAYTTRALITSGVVSFLGAAGVMTTLMEGFRRAHDLPLPKGSFWPLQQRAFTLVFLALVPMTVATLLVVFGHLMTEWTVGALGVSFATPVYLFADVVRWVVAFAGSVGIFAVIYHLGTDLGMHMWDSLEPMVREPWIMMRRDWSWRASLPGATVATALWFLATLVFGVYVTRFANYTAIYGPLGAGVALLVWMYLIALSVLIGAEFNAQLAAHGPRVRAAETTEALWKTPSRKRRRTGRMADG
jgi:membrane protein